MLKVKMPLSMLLTFIYGVSVGHYKTFPFNEIKAVKDLVSERSLEFLVPLERPYYLDKTSFYRLNSQSDYDVVFVGDSITDASDWFDIFPNHIIANRGINGDTTAGVLNRIDTIINTKAEKAFVMIGTNDIGRGIDIEIIFNNYISILEQLKSNNIEPIVQSTLLTDGSQRDNKIIDKLNYKLKIFCSDKNITYVNLNAHLSIKGKLNDEYSNDGLHLNGQGYVVWSKAILDYIK